MIGKIFQWFRGKIISPYIPSDLDDAIECLEDLLSEEDMDYVRTCEESDMSVFHFNVGMAIRNRWGLWGKSRLAQWFNGIGIYHPDDMSGIIFHSLWRKVHSKPENLEGQVKHYQDYWAKTNRDPSSFPKDDI